jgi:hypothetical protein
MFMEIYVLFSERNLYIVYRIPWVKLWKIIRWYLLFTFFFVLQYVHGYHSEISNMLSLLLP